MEEKKFVQTTTAVPGTLLPKVLGVINSGTAGTDTLNSTGFVVGAGNGQRVGLRIRIREVRFDWAITPNVVNAMGNGTTMRWALVQDNNPNGAFPAFASIFENSTNCVWAPKEVNRNRFKILKQGVHQMVTYSVNATTGAAATCGPPTQGSWTVRPNKIVIFNSATATISELLNVNWYLIVGADADTCCDMNVIMTLKYTDA